MICLCDISFDPYAEITYELCYYFIRDNFIHWILLGSVTRGVSNSEPLKSLLRSTATQAKIFQLKIEDFIPTLIEKFIILSRYCFYGCHCIPGLPVHDNSAGKGAPQGNWVDNVNFLLIPVFKKIFTYLIFMCQKLWVGIVVFIIKFELKCPEIKSWLELVYDL